MHERANGTIRIERNCISFMCMIGNPLLRLHFTWFSVSPLFLLVPLYIVLWEIFCRKSAPRQYPFVSPVRWAVTHFSNITLSSWLTSLCEWCHMPSTKSRLTCSAKPHKKEINELGEIIRNFTVDCPKAGTFFSYLHLWN